MKSILNQLAKYQPPQEDAPKINVPQQDHTDGIDLQALAERIAYRPENVQGILKKLGSMPRTQNMGILYPVITLARYHLYYNWSHMTSEEATDAEIMEFVQAADKEQYRDRFVAALDQATIRATLIRCLLATFEDFEKPKDRLPSRLRPQICTKLGVSQTITLSQVVKLQENLNHEHFSIEQHILSRLAYVIIWNNLQNNGTEVLSIGHIPALTHRPRR